MGCDIHLFAERKIEGKWVTADKWSNNPDYPQHSNKPREVAWSSDHDDSFYSDGRNYNLFCALAGARSYQFAGDPPQISPPKGMPEDCCEEIKVECESWDSDGHTHSWLTTRELEEFDWSSYGTTCDDFRNEVLPKMKTLGGPDDVRIVFWFDN